MNKEICVLCGYRFGNFLTAYCPNCGIHHLYYSGRGRIDVKITTFRKSGKCYGEGIAESTMLPLYRIWEKIKSDAENGIIPGLAEGSYLRNWILLVEVPEHPSNHPHLIIGE